MSFVAVAGVGAAAIGSATSIALANRQRKDAERLRNTAIDPGIQPNYGLQRTSQILGDNYSNFQLPGFTRFQEQIATAGATAMGNIREGATSSEDILSGATRVQGTQGNMLEGLYTEQASGRLQALGNWLNSVNAVGQDQVRVNTMQLDRYDSVLREAAALEGASMQNTRTGIDDLLMSAGPLIQNFLPQWNIDQNTGQRVRTPSVYKSIFGN